MSRLSVCTIEDPAGLDAHLDAWDALAVSAGRPSCAPAVMLGWWRHLAPSQAELRCVTVVDGQRLVGIAPYFASRGGQAWWSDYRLLGSGCFHGLGALCAPADEAAVAAAVVGELAGYHPRPHRVTFEGIEAGSRWPEMIAGAWPGLPPRRYTTTRQRGLAVTVEREGSFSRWWAGQSKNFRQQMGRMRRRAEREGAALYQATEAADVRRAVASMGALHRRRWQARGQRGSIDAATERALAEAAATLGPDRLRLWLLEVDGVITSVQLFLAAGGEVCYWNGGWDEDYARYKPAMLTILAALEDCFARGEHRLDLGAGEHDYKRRIADHAYELRWCGLMPRDATFPARRLATLPHDAEWAARRTARRLPRRRREQLARLRRTAARS